MESETSLSDLVEKMRTENKEIKRLNLEVQTHYAERIRLRNMLKEIVEE